MKETKEQLQAQAAKIRDKLDAIDAREWRERNKGLPGKCFKYHNSYGGDSQRWWLYAKVQKAKTKYEIRGLQFATDCNGKIELQPNSRIGPFPGEGSGWVPIKTAEFNREFAKLKRAIAALRTESPEQFQEEKP